jgi:hypothetical protein
MAGKLIQLIVQLLLDRNIDLVGSFANDGNRFVNVASLALYVIKTPGFHVIGNAGTKLAS